MRKLVELVRERMRVQPARTPVYPLPGNKDGNYILQTKPGGIPARVGAVCGKALCKLLYIDDSDTLQNVKGADGDVERMVWNTSTEAVAGTTYIQAKLVASRLVADWEQCE